MRRYTPDASDHLHFSGLARVSPFPIGDQVSQGIGIQFHDFLVPLRGPEQFESSKAVSAIPGSTEVAHSESKANSTAPATNQEGFGARSSQQLSQDSEDPNIGNESNGKKDFVPVNDSDDKQSKLGSIFEAMKQASFSTSHFAYKPKASPPKKAKKSASSHKFQLD